MTDLTSINDETFEAVVLKSEGPVLVDFWADWCGSCKQLSPILNEIAAEHGDKIRIVTMDADGSGVTAANYGVTGLPAMNLYHNGELIKQIVGAKAKATLLRELADFI